jgi:hypothetical protein
VQITSQRANSSDTGRGIFSDTQAHMRTIQ